MKRIPLVSVWRHDHVVSCPYMEIEDVVVVVVDTHARMDLF